MAEVVTLEGNPFKPEEAETKPELHRPADILRNIAKEIDKGDFGEIEGAVVILSSDKGVEIFGGGKSCMSSYAVALCELGKLKLLKDMV